MAKINKPEVKSVAPNPTPTKTVSSPTKKPQVAGVFMFEKMNYILMIAGLVVMAIGYVLMSGGATTDPNVFDKAEIYSARRITIAPIVILIGFIIELVAIFYKSPESSSSLPDNN
jgi:hypothetical protein